MKFNLFSANLKFDDQKLQLDKALIQNFHKSTKLSDFICIQSQQAASAEIPPFDRITAHQEQQYQQRNSLKLSGYDCGPTLKTFDELATRYNAPQQLIENILKQDWLRPSFCQQAAIPAIMAGLDSVCISQTGSGKTASYLIPLLLL